MPWKRQTVEGISRDRLVEAATGVYCSHDYDEVSIEDLAAAAGTTPEAIRMQFPTLPDLYAEVYRAAHARVGDELGERLTSDDPVTLMRRGIDGFLELFSTTENRRLLLLNPPQALGYRRWREVGNIYGTMLVDAAISDAMDKGVIREQSVRPLASVLVGMLEEGAHWVAEQPDREAALAQARQVCYDVLDGLVIDRR